MNDISHRTENYQIDIMPFIEGEFVQSSSDAVVELFDPATGRKSVEVPIGAEIDIEKAVSSARAAYEDGRWCGRPPSQRREVLLKFANMIEAAATELDTLDALDMGKPISLPMGAVYAAEYLRYAATAIDKVFGDVYQSDETTLVTQRRIPQGVVAAVVPWNFPTTNAVIKLAPALAAGNCVVLKPSESSPRSSLRLAQMAIEAGVAPGVLNVVPGVGSTVGRALALHMDVDMLTFTGSPAVGKLMLQYSGQSNMKLVHAECGGKSPQVVFADFENLDTVADNVAQNLLINQGQLCVAGTRLLVQKEIEAALVEKVAERFESVVAGDPLEADTTFGPLVNQKQMEKVLTYIDEGNQCGAQLVCGGGRLREESGGFFVAPTLFRQVPPSSTIAQDEIFGPVLSVSAFSTMEEAIHLANSTIYGLFATIWTTQLSTGMKMAKGVRSNVVVNACCPVGEGPGFALSTEPYGQSGVGVESGLTGLESYLRRQLVWFNHG